jgi:hypothetical protein
VAKSIGVPAPWEEILEEIITSREEAPTYPDYTVPAPEPSSAIAECPCNTTDRLESTEEKAGGALERSIVPLERSVALQRRSAVFLAHPLALQKPSTGALEQSVVLQELSAMLLDQSVAFQERSRT